MKLDGITRPACISGRDHGQRVYVCATFRWTYEEYANHSQYLARKFFPNQRAQIFQDGEKVSFKDNAKQNKVFELIRADPTVISWLTTTTIEAIDRMKGNNTVNEVFYWVVLKMAVYKIQEHLRSLRSAQANTFQQDVADEITDDESYSELPHRTSSSSRKLRPSHANTSRYSGSAPDLIKGTVARTGTQRPRRFADTQRYPIKYRHSLTDATVNFQEEDSDMDLDTNGADSLKFDELVEKRPDASNTRASETKQPPNQVTPKPDVIAIPETKIETRNQLTIADTDWRWKIILVHFTNNKNYPFVVRAQPTLREKDPIFSHDISHKIFMGRVQRQIDGTIGLTFSRIIFTDTVFGTKYNMADEHDFFEALTMHEYDHEFSTKTSMEVFVEE